MTTKRIISRIDLKGNKVVKGFQMEGLREIGIPSNAIRATVADGADEIFLVDVVASLYRQDFAYESLLEVSTESRVPVTFAGGIKSLETARRAFIAGADRIAINSQAVKEPSLLHQLSNLYGSQSIVSSVEVRFDDMIQAWFVFTDSGRNRSKWRIEDWLQKIQELGVGEVFITAIDRDGTLNGPDLELIKCARKWTNLPMIYSGGIRSTIDIRDSLKCDIEGVAIGRAAHEGKITISETKSKLIFEGLEMRNQKVS